jgi:hypothetical protein
MQIGATGPTLVTLKFLGTLTSSAVGTVAAVTAPNPATSVQGFFTQTGGDPAIADLSRMRITASGTGSHVGAVSYVAGFSGADPTKPFENNWITPNSAFLGFPSVGDSYVVDTLATTVENIHARIESQTSAASGPQILQVVMQDCFVKSQAGSQSNYHVISDNVSPPGSALTWVFATCSFGDVAITGFSRSNVKFIGCEFQKNVVATLGSFLNATNCTWRKGIFIDLSSTIQTQNSQLFDGVNSVQLAGPSTIESSGDWQFTRGGATSAIALGAFTQFNVGTTQLWGGSGTFTTGMTVPAWSGAPYSTASTQFNIPATTQALIGTIGYTAAQLPIFDAEKGAGIVKSP